MRVAGPEPPRECEGAKNNWHNHREHEDGGVVQNELLAPANRAVGIEDPTRTSADYNQSQENRPPAANITYTISCGHGSSISNAYDSCSAGVSRAKSLSDAIWVVLRKIAVFLCAVLASDAGRCLPTPAHVKHTAPQDLLRSDLREAAIHRQFRAGHIAAVVARKEHHGF